MFEALDRQGTHTTKWEDAQKKFGSADLLPLWVADMDLAAPRCVQEALQKRAMHPIYGYTVYPEAYYEAIAHWCVTQYGWEIQKEWIVPCYGVVPSLNFALQAYSNEGDGVIIQTPLYPPFASSVKHQNREVLDNTLLYQGGRYVIDFEDFEAKAKAAKLFLLCSPHNPSGRAWQKEELERMVEICLKHDVLIISDEIHADIIYQKRHTSIGALTKIQHQCVIFNAPSKSFNIAGLNSSYAIIPNLKLRQRYMIEQNRSGISNGNPFGIEGLIAAYQGGASWLEQLKVHLWENSVFVREFLEKHHLPITAVPTEATFLMWLDCHQMGLTHQALVNFFVHEAKLGLNDGKSFGDAGEGFMRLNIGTSREVLEEAMGRLLHAYKERK